MYWFIHPCTSVKRRCISLSLTPPDPISFVTNMKVASWDVKRSNSSFSSDSVRSACADAPFAEYVVIKPAGRELATVFAEHTGLKKALKIDCEGSEMEILEDLKKAGLLAQVDLILLEWHFGYGRDLIDLLTDCGFVLTCRHDIPEKQGVITAFRSKTAV
jgi:hypothetical protein